GPEDAIAAVVIAAAAIPNPSPNPQPRPRQPNGDASAVLTADDMLVTTNAAARALAANFIACSFRILIAPNVWQRASRSRVSWATQAVTPCLKNCAATLSCGITFPRLDAIRRARSAGASSPLVAVITCRADVASAQNFSTHGRSSISQAQAL